MSRISSNLRYEIRNLLHEQIGKLSDEEIDAVVNILLENLVREKLRRLGDQSK